MKTMVCAIIVLSMVLFPAFSQAQTGTLADLASRAKKGDAAAQVELGGKYYYGDGVEKNIPEAIRLFTLAVDKKNLDAQLGLGWIYGHTEGYLDAVKSAKYYGLAAVQNMTEAQTALGDIYETGKGVKIDKVEALSWYLIALHRGDPVADLFIDAIKPGMTAAQVKEAEARASAF